MKGLIIIHGMFAKFMHAVALELKNRHGVENFCAYVYGRQAEEFIKTQKDIKYSTIIVDQDLHAQYKNENLDLDYIKFLEKEYGIPNLWPFIMADRTLTMSIPPKPQLASADFNPAYSHEDLLRIQQVKMRALIKLLKDEKPNFILFAPGGVGMGAYMTLWHMAKKLGIKTIYYETARIERKVVITENYNLLTSVEEAFEKFKNHNKPNPYREKAKNIIDEFRKNGSLKLEHVAPGEQTKENPMIFLKILRTIKFIFYLIHHQFFDIHKDDYTNEKIIPFLSGRIRNKVRKIIGCSDLYDKPDLKEDFALCTLHFEPEAVLSVNIPFINQLTLIHQIARSLPVYFKLYVKDHPGMTEMNVRPRNFYKKIKKIPGVRLIDPNTSTFDLIKNAKIVFPVIGTAGFEACLLGKPVITSGEIFYNKLSFVKRCKEIENLPFMVKEQLENFKYDENEVINLISAMFEEGVDLKIFRVGAQYLGCPTDFETIRKEPGLKEFADKVAETIKQKN